MLHSLYMSKYEYRHHVYAYVRFCFLLPVADEPILAISAKRIVVIPFALLPFAYAVHILHASRFTPIRAGKTTPQALFAFYASARFSKLRILAGVSCSRD